MYLPKLFIALAEALADKQQVLSVLKYNLSGLLSIIIFRP